MDSSSLSPEDSLYNLLHSFSKVPLKASLTVSDLAKSLTAVPFESRYEIIAKTQLNDGKTFLQKALERGSAELVSCLLQHVSEEDGKKLLDSARPALHAVMLQSVDKVKYLLDSIPSENRHILLMSKDDEGKTSLHCASSFGSAAAVKCILDSLEGQKKQELLMMKDNEGSTALHFSIKSQSEDIVKYILDCIAPANIQEVMMMKNNVGRTSLHYACMQGSAYTVQYILNFTAPEKRHELLAIADNEEMTPLNAACRIGSIDKVKFLMDSIAPGNRASLLMMQDKQGRTPLHHASRSHSVDKLKYLLDSVAPDSRIALVMLNDKEGKTSLHHSSRSGTEDNVKYILDCIEPENRYQLLTMRDNEGMTSLHHAVLDESKSVEKLNYLLQYLSLHHQLELLETKNVEGKTALEVAMEVECQDAVETLKDFHISALENTIPATIDLQMNMRSESPKRPSKRSSPKGERRADPSPPEGSSTHEPPQDLSLQRLKNSPKTPPRQPTPISDQRSKVAVKPDVPTEELVPGLSWTNPTTSYLGLLQQPLYPTNQPPSYPAAMSYLMTEQPITPVSQAFHSLPPSISTAEIPAAVEPTNSSQSMAYVTPFNQASVPTPEQPTLTPLEPKVVTATVGQASALSRYRPILPSGVYTPASNDSETSSSMAGTKRTATIDSSTAGQPSYKRARFDSAIEGETVKMICAGERYLFMFAPNSTVGDFTSDVQSMTGHVCTINTLDGFTSTSSVTLKSLPIPFIISAGGSETIVTSKPEQFDAPPSNLTTTSDESAQKRPIRFGRMSNAGQVIELLTFVHEHVVNGKTINAALKLAEKDRKTVDRFKNIYYLHVTNSAKLNQLDLEWQKKGRPDALPGLNEMARKAMDWRLLRDMADEGKATLFGGIQDE